MSTCIPLNSFDSLCICANEERTVNIVFCFNNVCACMLFKFDYN